MFRHLDSIRLELAIKGVKYSGTRTVSRPELAIKGVKYTGTRTASRPGLAIKGVKCVPAPGQYPA
ncbi:hypothetical protein C2U48_31410 (plasmid) [Escherichia coli]|uniref:hypothetical protein n=2 Tax=Enterobacteriaceae TaxID=543 RepID=UPI0004BC1876|nr:hypothetical protein [Klebsiella michiganensis]AUV35011.1 hypothetical protein C2U48_31410 [Escherichia coli]POV65506.1 hypothetical protein C3404_07305 [Citrobacter freundii complex sp. CFNIH11]BEJ36695.1 hypothetical protein OIPHN330_53150 [Citrobacter freundii]AWF55859.1 hypothetical protein CSC12_6095 [Klebsiella michiganensis]EEW2103509.1 hypothetical protein [Escherichia coli]